MGEFMPLERHEIAQFGQLTAMQLDADTVIVLELKPGMALPDGTAAILRQRLTAIFPNNPVIVIEPEKLSIKVVDQPAEATAVAKPTAWEIFSPVAVELAAIVIVLSAKKVVRRIRRRRAA